MENVNSKPSNPLVKIRFWKKAGYAALGFGLFILHSVFDILAAVIGVFWYTVFGTIRLCEHIQPEKWYQYVFLVFKALFLLLYNLFKLPFILLYRSTLGLIKNAVAVWKTVSKWVDYGLKEGLNQTPSTLSDKASKI